jgi:outer membrane protein assembly factor BamB
MPGRTQLPAAIAILGLLAAPRLAIGEANWPQWRGPNRDGVSKETGLLTQWPKDGPPLVWQIKGLGAGYASVAIADGRIYTMGTRSGKSVLIALKLDDGGPLWAREVGGGSEPNCTPTVDGGLVYGLTKGGDFICADAKTGEPVWRKNFAKDFGGQMMSGWGYSESPLIDGDRLVCTPGAKDAAVVALNKKTGVVIWKASVPDDLGRDGKDGAGYSSIVISHGAGVKQYVQLMGRGIVAFAAADGKYLWHYNKVANGTANIPTPVVDGDYVFCTSGYGDGGSALLKLSKSADGGVQADEVYHRSARELQNHHGGVILVGDYLYGGHGHNKGMPFCLEMKTGKLMWRNEDPEIQGHNSAAVVYADGHLIFRYEDGTVSLIEASPKGYKETGSFVLPHRHGPSWPHPVVADGRLYLRNQDELLCYDIRKK